MGIQFLESYPRSDGVLSLKVGLKTRRLLKVGYPKLYFQTASRKILMLTWSNKVIIVIVVRACTHGLLVKRKPVSIDI